MSNELELAAFLCKETILRSILFVLGDDFMAMTSPYQGRYAVRNLTRMRIFPGRYLLGSPNKYLAKAPANILPEDLDDVLSPEKYVGAPAILRRCIDVIRVYGTRGEDKIANGMRLTAVHERFCMRLDAGPSEAGAERITVEIARNTRTVFKVVAERAEGDGDYAPRQIRCWRPGNWQGTFLNAFPINAARQPFRPARDQDRIETVARRADHRNGMSSTRRA